MKSITPCLWFDGQAEEAANFYTSLFKNSRILRTSYYGEAGPGPAGTVMTVTFELDGRPFIGLNAGPHFKFNEAVSFAVYCETQEDIDYFWEKLSEGGEKVQCGWLKDKFGVSWQIVPTVLETLMTDADAEKTKRVVQTMLSMTKLNIAELEQAHAGA